MKHVYLPIKDCQCGDVLACDIFNSQGQVLLSRNTALNEYLLQKLTGLGIRQVVVYDREELSGPGMDPTVLLGPRSRNGAAVEAARRLIRNLSSGRSLPQEAVTELCSLIFKHPGESQYALQCLQDLRKIDEYTYTHSVKVGFYSILLAKWLQLSEEEVCSVAQAGLLHDLGKIQVNEEILKKEGKLAPEEFEEIKLHTVHGFNLIKDAEGIGYEVKKTVLMHHEREDGSGYPLKSKSHMIHLYAKIVAITDVFDAMTSDRVYKKGVTPFEAFEMFQTTGTSLFDTHITKVFLRNLSAYYTGSKIRMPTGEVGDVVYIPPHSVANPVILINSGLPE